MGFRLANPALLALGGSIMALVSAAWIRLKWQSNAFSGVLEAGARTRAGRFEPVRIALSAGRGFSQLHFACSRSEAELDAFGRASLSAGEELSLVGRLRRSRRGAWPPPRTVALTAHPFGFVGVVLPCQSFPEEQLVLPRLGRVSPGLLERGARDTTRQDARARRRGAGAEVHRIRPFRAGDSRRHVHWRSSARTGELMVREFEDERAGAITLVVGGEGVVSRLRSGPFEVAVSLAASLLHHWRREGREVTLLLVGRDPIAACGSRRSDFKAAEEALARLVPWSGWPSLPPPRRGGTARCVVVHSGLGSGPRYSEAHTLLDARRELAAGRFRLLSNDALAAQEDQP